MRRHWLVLSVLAMALVQAYFISGASGSRFSINLVLVLLLYITLERSLRLAVILAAWGGLWLDLAAGQLGPRMLLLIGSVLLVAWLMRMGLELGRKSSQLAVAGALSLLYSVGLLLLTWLSLRQLAWSGAELMWWSLEAVLTVIFAWAFGRRLQLMVSTN